MWKVLCSFLMLMGLSGGAALAWTADDYGQLLGLYDARGWGFMASVIAFSAGLLLLLMSGSSRKPRSAEPGPIAREEPLAVEADGPSPHGVSSAAPPPSPERPARSDAPRHPAFKTDAAPKPN